MYIDSFYYKKTFLIFCILYLSFLNDEVLAANLVACGSINSPGSYVLQNDVISNGTCFKIAAANVTLDLNGHTVIYDDGAPISVPNGSFESSLLSNWDISNAANAERIAGTFIPSQVNDGDYSLRFSLPFSGSQYVRSSTVTLAANTTYDISVMYRNNGAPDAASVDCVTATVAGMTMKIELEGTTSSYIKTGATCRGYEYINFTHTTGASPENHIIRATLGNVPAGATTYAYLDNIRILKKQQYGVYVNAHGATITNGTITQGQGGSFESDAVRLSGLSFNGFNVSYLTLTASGPNAKVIRATDAQNSNIHHNTIYHNTRNITDRDGYTGVAIDVEPNNGSYNSKIYSNVILTGPQTGIRLYQAVGQIKNEIYDNDITLQSLFTNDFAIVALGSKVYNNRIHCGSGNNSCRGLHIRGTGGVYYNNIIDVQQLLRNQEYNGCEGGANGGAGAYGIQLEGTPVNTEVYGNTVTSTGTDCGAVALRISPDYGANISSNIHDNIFTAIRYGTARADAMKLANVYDTDILINNNTFKTNHRWIFLDDGNSAVMTAIFNNSRFETTGTIDSPFRPFEVNNGKHGAFMFKSNTYGTGDQNRFESEFFRIGGVTKDALSTIAVSYPPAKPKGFDEAK